MPLYMSPRHPRSSRHCYEVVEVPRDDRSAWPNRIRRMRKLFRQHRIDCSIQGRYKISTKTSFGYDRTYDPKTTLASLTTIVFFIFRAMVLCEYKMLYYLRSDNLGTNTINTTYVEMWMVVVEVVRLSFLHHLLLLFLLLFFFVLMILIGVAF